MKIKITKSGLMVEPETEFEETYIKGYMNEEYKVFVKTGTSADQIIGLKIIKNENKCETPVLDKVSRVEVIDAGGRSYTNRDVKNVSLSMQDDNRTLKVFIDDGKQSAF